MKNSNKLPIQKQKEIADRLKTLRTTAGYTQGYIAQKMDITEKTYRKWEVGTYTKDDIKYYPAIDCENLFKLSDIYHVSIDYLLCRSNCTSVENHYISKETGLSGNAINYLREAARSKRYIDIINNIFLKHGNFDNALFHIDKYMKNVYLYQNLTKIRQKRHENIISECIQEDGELTSYNYPYNDTLDKKIHEVGRDLDIEEFKIDQHFKFIIQEIERIAKEKAPDTD